MADPQNPDTLPADFFTKPIAVNPDTLPADFFTTQTAAGHAQPSEPGLLASWWEQVDPVAAGNAIIEALKDPGKAFQGYAGQNEALRQKAVEAWQQGDYPGAAQHSLNWLLNGVPGVGAALDKAGEEAKAGQIPAALGTTAGVATNLFGPELVGKVPLPKSVRTPRLTNPNAAEVAAMDFLQDRGVPVPAGARTGNAFVKNVQKGVDATPLGAVVAQNAGRETTAALRRTAADLTADATPHTSAETHYSDFRMAEADPRNARSVPTGEVDPKGNPVMVDMQMPVPVGLLKPTLQPIFDEMQWMPMADRNASAGYQAIKRILEGPDYIPASQAEIGLGGIKKMAREGAGRNAGLAKFITPKLQDLIDNTVSNTGGARAVDSLRQARSAAASEAGRDWLVDTFKKAEAEGGFNREQGIWADWLRLKDEAKRTMFTSAQVADLDKFFLGVKKLAENPNPSGTALVGTSMGAGGLVFTHPQTGIPLLLGAGALSKLLHSPAGVRALTEGLSIPLGSPRAVLLANRILQIAGDALEPPQQQR